MSKINKIPVFLFLFFTFTTINAQNLDSLLSILPKQKKEEEVTTLRKIGNEYLKYNLDSSSVYLQKALNIAKKNKYSTEEALIYRNIGKLKIFQGSYSEAAKNTQKSIKLFEQQSDFYNTAITYNNLGIIYSYSLKPDSEYICYNKALKLNIERKDTTEIVETYNNFGTFFYYSSEYDSALYYFDKGMKLLKNKESNITKGAICNNFALVYQAQGKLLKAIDYYVKALEFYKKEDDIRIINLIYNNIGSLYIELSFFNKAAEYFLKNIKYYHNTGKISEYLMAMNNYGNCLSNTGKIDSALAVYKRAISIADTTNISTTKALLYKNTGEIYIDKKDYSQAAVWLYKSLELIKKSDNKFDLASVYVSLGQAEFYLGNIKKAKLYSALSEKVATEIGAYKILITVYLLRGEIFQLQRNYKMSSFYFDKYIQLNDSVLSNDIRKQISDLETRYQTEKKEKEIAQLKIKSATQELSIERRDKILYILVSIFLLLIISLIFIIRHNRIKQKQKSLELEQRLLRSQMNPHFIFNALSCIQEYIINQKPLEAGSYLSNFAKLMRSILINSATEFIPLEDEIETLEHYLQLQKMRFPDKFNYEIIVPDDMETYEIVIPPMLLQPFIENAVKHGIEKKIDGIGKLTVVFSENNNSLLLKVQDNGVGLKFAEEQNEKKHRSMATNITYSRIANFKKSYKQNVHFEIGDLLNEKQEFAGTQVSFELPKKYLSNKQN